jgi:hypothetical protein
MCHLALRRLANKTDADRNVCAAQEEMECVCIARWACGGGDGVPVTVAVVPVPWYSMLSCWLSAACRQQNASE